MCQVMWIISPTLFYLKKFVIGETLALILTLGSQTCKRLGNLPQIKQLVNNKSKRQTQAACH